MANDLGHYELELGLEGEVEEEEEEEKKVEKRELVVRTVLVLLRKRLKQSLLDDDQEKEDEVEHEEEEGLLLGLAPLTSSLSLVPLLHSSPLPLLLGLALNLLVFATSRGSPSCSWSRTPCT